MRLSKYIALCGVCSRRKAEEAILAGLIKVNGQTITKLGTKITQDDTIDFCGKNLHPPSKFVYIMLNKPEGYITTAKDQFGRPSVLDLAKIENVRIVPVGRLDCATSGMLILTNDGNLVHKLTHPSHHISKTYHARIEGTPNQQALAQIRQGMVIDGYKTSGAQVQVLKSEKSTALVEVSILEGRNHQVRKMFAQLGHKVTSLRRVATGQLPLGDLRKGQWRHLTDQEIAYLKDLTLKI